MTRLGEKKEGDLSHVGSRGDVNQVVLVVRIEGDGAREVVERAVDLLEIPGIIEVEAVQPHLGLGRDCGNVLLHRLGQGGVLFLEEDLEAIDQQLVVLADR